MEDLLVVKLSEYFNKILKESLKYREIFKISININERVILLDSGNQEKLKNSLQLGISKNYQNVNILLIPISETELVIQY